MVKEKIIKSTEEQATASWISYLNQLRVDQMTDKLREQEQNLGDALSEIDKTLREVDNLIASNRGGSNGLHGFIAEAAEVGIENARKNLLGNADSSVWVNDNGMTDLVQNGIGIQQKFYRDGLSLGAIAKHMEKYPEFLKSGNKYQIPRDQYEKINYYFSVSVDEIHDMPQTGEFSFQQWKAVHMFFEKDDIDIADIVPSQLSYDEVQKNQIRETLKNEKSDLRKQSEEQSTLIKEEYKPGIKDAAKSAAISAALESGVAFAQAIIAKKVEGIKIKDFTEDDWIEILQCTGKGSAKGGIRGATVFSLENFSNTPESLTSALVTASIGMAEQAHLLRIEKITEQQFIENSETLCLDTAVSAIASLLGQTLIPVPVVGAAIGNSVGMMMYQTARDYLSEREQKIIAGYLNEIRQISEDFDVVYKNYMEQLAHDFDVYIQILQRTYSVDVTEAFQASVDLAKTIGVPCDEILDTKEKVAAFFLD